MNVDFYIDKVIISDEKLNEEVRETIIDDIVKRNNSLPIKKPFQREDLKRFDDKALVLYLSDVYELFTMKYFLHISKYKF